MELIRRAVLGRRRDILFLGLSRVSKDAGKPPRIAMNDDAFAEIEQSLAADGTEACFDLLIERFRSEEKYPQLFEALLMKKRHELDLPLLSNGPLNDLPEEKQKAYDAGSVEAAREVGGLFLARGNIAHAWPYYRAVGEAGPIHEAIDRLEPGEEQEGVIEIAYNERVHPRKGFELLLETSAHAGRLPTSRNTPAPMGFPKRHAC